MKRYTIEEAKNLLYKADIFHFNPDDPSDVKDEEFADDKSRRLLNMNDVWAWAYAYCEEVKDEEFPELARLFSAYGWCGVLYWVSEKNGGMKSEFHDNNRFIEFVRNEERILKEVPDYNKRAYHKAEYRIGFSDEKEASE